MIVGYSGRYPGADNSFELWKKLRNKVDCVGPPKRYEPGFMGLPPRAGHLNDIDRFDAKHFKFNKQQVAKLCPQTRLLLEVAEEALLDARLDISQMRGSNTGVYVGASTSDFHANVLQGHIDGYENVGGDMSMIANKISYHYDFKGPSCSYSTACSSSMQAFHEAMVALNTGEIDFALVGGASLHLRPNVSSSFKNYGMLSPTGTCHVFSGNADGYCRSEGICMIVISRSATVGYARVLGTGANHDGYTSKGITFPNGEAQIALVCSVLKKTGVDAKDVEYVEAHGTGTTAGDGVETTTHSTVFPPGVKIGSIKSNVGHSEVASGIFGVIKCLMAYEHGLLPPNLHFENSPHKCIQNGHLQVVDELQEWGRGISLVMNYGFGGSNAMVLLADGGLRYNPVNLKYVRGFGNSPDGIPAPHLHYQPYNKTLYNFRTVLNTETGVVTPSAVTAQNPKVVFVMTGRGCIRKNMGQDLMKSSIVFRETIQKLGATLKTYRPELELEKEFLRGAWDNPMYTAVGINAFEIGVLNMLREEGIEPDYILGHSVGEFAAAYADGCVTADEAILLIAQREQAMHSIRLDTEVVVETEEDLSSFGGRRYSGTTWFVPRQKLEEVRPLLTKLYASDGIMVVVGATEEIIQPVIDRVGTKNTLIACFNSPSGLTLAGPKSELALVTDALKAEVDDLFVRKLNTPSAFHNKYFVPPSIASDMTCKVENRPMNKMVSTVALDRRIVDVQYFVDNMMFPVRFYQAIETLPSGSVLFELGPKPILLGQIKRTRSDVTLVPLIGDPSDETELMARAKNKLHLANVDLPPARNTELQAGVQLPLAQRVVSAGIWAHTDVHDVALDTGESARATVRYDLTGDHSFMLDHKINNSAIFPAAGHVVTMWKIIGAEKPVRLTDVRILQSVPLEDVDFLEFQVATLETGRNRVEMTVFHNESVVSSAVVSVLDESESSKPEKSPRRQCLEEKQCFQKADFYNIPNRVGYNYGLEFRKVAARSFNGNNLWLDNIVHWSVYMDQMLQAGIAPRGTCGGLELPTKIDSITIWNPNIAEVDSWLRWDHNTETVGNTCIRLEKCTTTVAPRPVEPARPDLWGTMFLRCGRNVLPEDPVLKNLHAEECTHIKETLGKTGECTPPKIEKVSVFDLEKLEDCWNSNFLTRGTKKFDPASLLTQILFDEFQTLRVLEVGAGTGNLRQRVLSVLKSKAYEYIAADSSSPPDASGPVKPLKWDFSKPFPKNVIPQVIVCSNIHPSLDDLQKLFGGLPEGGFLLLEENCLEALMLATEDKEQKEPDVWAELLTAAGFLTVTSVETFAGSTFLCRKVTDQNQQRTLCKSWNDLQKDIPRQIFVTYESDVNPSGFGKSARAEGYDVVVANRGDIPPKVAALDLAVNTCRKGEWGFDLNFPLGRTETTVSAAPNMELVIENPGMLETLCFKEISDGDIQIKYASLNYKDLMIMVGKLKLPGLPVGFEFAGVNEQGQKVMGFGYKQGHYAKSCRSVDLDFLVPIPENMRLEDAATIPVVYATAYEALVVQSNVQQGQTVLIHGCTGGVGHAAVAIAQHRGCEVFGTCSAAKRDYAINTLNIKPENLGNSRDNSFYELIKTRTNGEGVDVVLNSLSSEKLLKSIDLVREFGHFCEIGKYDYQQGTNISMALFKENINYHLFDLSNYGKRPEKIKVLADLLVTGMKSGEVRPLPVKSYGVKEIRSAIDYMAKSRHIGKVVIEMDFSDESVVQQYFTSGTHVITGGLGGFGMELAKWLGEQGAEKVVLTSRSGIRTAWQAFNVAEMKKRCAVEISTDDLCDFDQTTSLLKRQENLRGVWHLAGVLRDGTLEKMEPDAWDLVVRTKAQVRNLSRALAEIGQDGIQTFCAFSSVSQRFGNFGQANYAFGNSICEEVCYERFERGKHAAAIQWGVIGDVGMAANLGFNVNSEELGSEPLPIAQCLNHLHAILTNTDNCVFLCNREKRQETTSSLSPVERVLDLLGYTLDEVRPEHTLGDLGVDSLQAARVLNILVAAGANVKLDEVKDLTVSNLLELDE